MIELLKTILWSSLGLFAFFYLSYYSLMVYEAKKPNNVQKQRIFPKVSLVIPAHNEGKVILRKLENVKNLDYPKEKLEVFVVDDGSTDNTCQVVQNFINQNAVEVQLELLVLPRWLGKASALNYAWQCCNGEIIIISDADTTFEESAVTKIVQNFADSAVGAATGRLSVASDSIESLSTKMEKSYRNIFDVLRIGESRIDSTPIFNGLLSAFRRELLDKLKPDTLADDTELSLTIREKGWKAVYDPQAIAYEYPPDTLKLRVNQKLRRGRGIIQSFIRHRKMLFNPKYGKYGFVIFPSEFFMHVVSPILILLITVLTLTTIALTTPSSIIYFLLIAISLLVAYGLLSLVQRVVMPNKRVTINPIAAIVTFVVHQIYLILSLFSLFIQRISGRWKKTEDIRTLWKTKE